MKFQLMLLCFLYFTINPVWADVVDELKSLAEESESFREICADCYLAMRLQREKGWESEACNQYKILGRESIWNYKSRIEIKTQTFRQYAKMKKGSPSRIKRGLKYLIMIESNMASLNWFGARFDALIK